jgi:hypothetical protein
MTGGPVTWCDADRDAKDPQAIDMRPIVAQ